MFHDYKTAIREAAIKAKQSGKLMRRVFNKEEFLKQFPQAANDPRFMELMPETFRMDFTPLEQISVLELRQLCEAKPDHPLAILKRSQLLGLGDNQIVAVLIEELDILRQNNQPTTTVVSPPEPTLAPNEYRPEPRKSKKDNTVPKEGIVTEVVDDVKKEDLP